MTDRTNEAAVEHLPHCAITLGYNACTCVAHPNPEPPTHLPDCQRFPTGWLCNIDCEVPPTGDGGREGVAS